MCVDHSMKRTLLFDAHESFHRTVLSTLLGGGLLGLWHTLLGSHSGYLADLHGLRGTWAWGYGALAVGMLGGAALVPKTKRGRLGLVAMAVLGAASSGLAARYGWESECALGVGSVGVAAALALYLSSGLRLAHAALALGTIGAATWLAQRIPSLLGSHDTFLEMPQVVGNTISGMAMGLLVGAATAVRHLKWVRRTALDKDVAKLLPGADATDEVSKLVQQAATSYKQAIECLDDHTAAKAAASDLMGKIARFGKRWQDIDAQMPQGSRTELEARTTDLTARIEKATDDSVRSEYDRARSAVKEQLAYLDEIDKGRQRAIARLHHQVATLDRLRLAALRHRSVGASKLGEELRTLVEELGQAGQELDTAAELAELPG